jgi:hypothetical protein
MDYCGGVTISQLFPALAKIGNLERE